MNWGLSGLIRLSIAFCLIENYTAPETSFHAKADIKSPVSIRTAKSLKLGLKGWNFPLASLSSNSLQWNWFGLSNSLHFSAFTLSLSLSLYISLSTSRSNPNSQSATLQIKLRFDLSYASIHESWFRVSRPNSATLIKIKIRFSLISLSYKLDFSQVFFVFSAL